MKWLIIIGAFYLYEKSKGRSVSQALQMLGADVTGTLPNVMPIGQGYGDPSLLTTGQPQQYSLVGDTRRFHPPSQGIGPYSLVGDTIRYHPPGSADLILRSQFSVRRN